MHEASKKARKQTFDVDAVGGVDSYKMLRLQASIALVDVLATGSHFITLTNVLR